MRGAMSSRHLHDLPSSQPFRDHPDSIGRRVHHRLLTASSPLLIVSCALGAYWRDGLGVEHDETVLSEGDFAICAAARRARPLRRWYRVPLFWERGRGGHTPAMHMHAEALINQRPVHIDYVAFPRAPHRHRDAVVGLSSGASAQEDIRESETAPGLCESVVVEIWIFVDGRLAGCGGQRRKAIDGNACALPAVALVGRELAISVDALADESGPIAELWQAVEAKVVR